MGFEPKEGSASLFKNTRKDAPNKPDYTGEGLYKGEKVRLSAWLKTDKNGNPWFSIQIQEPFKPKANAERPKQQSFVGGMDDDLESTIPF